MRAVFVAVTLLAASAAACASREARVRGALLNAGLSPPLASCMAERMVDRLSIAQLRRLQSLSSLKRENVGELTVGEFLDRARVIGDPELLTVMSTVGLGCRIAA